MKNGTISINKLVESIPNRFRLCIQHNGQSISRILHRVHEYDNEHVPSIEELEEIGVNTPKDINCSFIGTKLIIAGIVLNFQKLINANDYFVGSIIDHPKHLDKNEFCHHVKIIVNTESKSKLVVGNYHCVSGNYISIKNFYKEFGDQEFKKYLDKIKEEYLIFVTSIE